MRNFIWLTALLGLSCAHRIDPESLRLAGRQDLDITQDLRLATPATIRGSMADLSKIKKEKRDELILRVNAEGSLYQANGRYRLSITAAAEPAFTAQKAEILALEQGKPKKMNAVGKSTLVFYPAEEDLRLAWHVALSNGMNQWDYFIDAQTGAVLFDQDRRRF